MSGDISRQIVPRRFPKSASCTSRYFIIPSVVGRLIQPHEHFHGTYNLVHNETLLPRDAILVPRDAVSLGCLGSSSLRLEVASACDVFVVGLILSQQRALEVVPRFHL
jgi:hypothetical protein